MTSSSSSSSSGQSGTADLGSASSHHHTASPWRRRFFDPCCCFLLRRVQRSLSEIQSTGTTQIKGFIKFLCLLDLQDLKPDTSRSPLSAWRSSHSTPLHLVRYSKCREMLFSRIPRSSFVPLCCCLLSLFALERRSTSSPSSPHVCEQSDHGDHADIWQLTGHSTTQETFICHFFSKSSCGTHTHTHTHTQTHTEEVKRLMHNDSQKPLGWNIEAAVKAVLPLCVCVCFVCVCVCVCVWSRWGSGPGVKSPRGYAAARRATIPRSRDTLRINKNARQSTTISPWKYTSEYFMWAWSGRGRILCHEWRD